MDLEVLYSGLHSSSAMILLNNIIKDVFPSVQTMHYDTDPESGFGRKLRRTGQTESPECAIVFLTPESRRFDWLIFETGALVGVIPTNRIFLVVAGMNIGDIPTGPLRTLQAFQFNEDGIASLLEKLSHTIADESIDSTQIVTALQNRSTELQTKIDDFTHRFPSAVKQPLPDCEGMTNTVFYQFDVKKSVRHKLESSDLEAGWSGNVRLFVNYTGLADENAFSRYRYAILAIGYPSTSEGEDAIRQVLYGEIGLELGEITSLDIRMQKIYAAFEQVVQH
jgi:hypothetical protein